MEKCPVRNTGLSQKKDGYGVNAKCGIKSLDKKTFLISYSFILKYKI